MQCFIGFQGAVLAGDFKQREFSRFRGFSRVVRGSRWASVRTSIGPGHLFLHLAVRDNRQRTMMNSTAVLSSHEGFVRASEGDIGADNSSGRAE
jgi:hypothetical protein